MAAELNAKLATASIPVAGRGICYVSFKANPTLPTNATADMSTLTDFESLGELSDGGFSESRSISSTDHKGAHGTIIMTTIDSDTTKYKAAFLEVSRAAVAKLRFGDTSVTETTGDVTKIDLQPYKGTPHAFVFEEEESNGYKRRTVIKRGVISAFDEVSHKKGDLMAYGMDITVNDTDDGSPAVVIYRAKLSA